MYQRILIPIDGSRCSDQALRQGLELAKHFGAEVTLLHVLDLALPYLGYEGAAGYPEVVRVLREGAEEILAAAKAKADELGVAARTVLVENRHPIEGILETEAAHDLTVIGTHGRRGFERFFMGSVTEGVLRRSANPHLVVRCLAES